MQNYNWIRFDWAMKRLLRNKANFAILEGFLSELLKRDVKIIRMLESEGNPAYYNDKYNRVDFLAKDETGEIFIVEVQNQSEIDYYCRMTYETVKEIPQFLDLGEHYQDIKKVYSVNIVYFDLGQGEDYVYHGTTEFYGIHKNDKLLLSESQKIEYDMMEPRDMFPEYYVLKVNSFDDVAKDTLDEWIYYFKNSEIKESFQAKGLKMAKELLRYEQLSENEKISYNRHVENLRYKASMVWSLKAEEEIRIAERAEEKGMKKGIALVAKKMKNSGVSVGEIAKLTGLTKDDIENLK